MGEVRGKVRGQLPFLNFDFRVQPGPELLMRCQINAIAPVENGLSVNLNVLDRRSTVRKSFTSSLPAPGAFSSISHPGRNWLLPNSHAQFKVHPRIRR
jgi:hypothetical protein